MKKSRERNASVKIAFIVANVVFLLCFFATFEVRADDVATVSEMDLSGASEVFANALMEGKTSLNIEKYNIPNDKVGELIRYSKFKNPMIFWYPETVEYSFSSPTKVVSELTWEQSYSDFSEIQEMEKELEEKLRQALNVAFNREMTDLEKIISAHDFLTETVEYKLEDEFSYTIYSALVRNKGVCEGYSLAFKQLMDYAGIECHIVISESLNHSWNIVKLDGEYYHIDVTFDDPEIKYNGAKITNGRETHKKLLCSDESFGCEADDVILCGDVPLPECKSSKYDDAFFKDVVGSMEYHGGDWYYVEPNEYINQSRKILCYKDGEVSVFLESEKPVYSVASHSGELYYSIGDTVYVSDFSSEGEVFCSTVGEIYGLSVQGNDLYFGVYRKKNYSVCGKRLPPNTNCIEGMSLSINSKEYVLNLFVKQYADAEDGRIKYTLDGQEKEILLKDVSLDGVISVPVSMEQFEKEIVISFVCGEKETTYKTSVKEYGEKILNGDFDDDVKKLVKSLFLYAGLMEEDVPDGFFDGFGNLVTDNSDEISHVKTEVITNQGFGVDVRFSVLGKAEFYSSEKATIKKDGLYYDVSIRDISIYNLDKTITISSGGIKVELSIFALASQMDEAVQNHVYFAHNYAVALNEYIKKQI